MRFSKKSSNSIKFFIAVLMTVVIVLLNGRLLAKPKLSDKPSAELVDKIVAVVNGEAILLSELEETQGQFLAEMKRLKKVDALGSPSEVKKKVLDQMINERLVTQEIERRGLSANETTIGSAIESVMQQNGFKSLEELRKALKEEGLTLDEYRISLKKQIETSRIMNSHVRAKVSVTDEDVEAAYRKRLNQAPSKTQMVVKMIYKKKPQANLQIMNRLKREIEAGIPFELVARRETEGPAKEEGGNIGLVSPNDLQPELANALVKLNSSEISPVIETKNGFYLLQCIDKKQIVSNDHSHTKELIREELTKLETEKSFDLFIRNLREKAHIEVHL